MVDMDPSAWVALNRSPLEVQVQASLNQFERMQVVSFRMDHTLVGVIIKK